jgi:nitrate reductase NapD
VTDELHIAGIIVYARPEFLKQITAHIALLPAAEIHAVSEDAKIIVTLETSGTRLTADYMDAIRDLHGVLDVSLVYQHAEPVAALQKEIES